MLLKWKSVAPPTYTGGVKEMAWHEGHEVIPFVGF